jgi:hypothetical protein
MARHLLARYGAGVRYGDIDVVADCGADPTWRTYCDDAFAAAVSGARPGQTIGIPPGLYKTRRPIIAPPYVGWEGSPATPLVGSWAEYGSVIKPGPDWAQGDCPLSAAIALLDQATGGYGTRSEEQHFRNLLLSGSALPAGRPVHGIASLDRVSRVQLRDVHVGRMTGDGIHQEYPGDQPGGWTGFHVFSRYNAGHGYLLRSADSNWTKCLSTNSGNNRTASGGVAFTGCRTDRSAAHGFLAAGGLAIPLSLTGCTFKRDGASDDAGHAGIRIRDFPGPVTITGCQVFPGLNDDGTGEVTPRQAIRVTGGSRAVFAGCYLQGRKRAWQADSSSATSYDRTTTWASGPTSAPVIVAGPGHA